MSDNTCVMSQMSTFFKSTVPVGSILKLYFGTVVIAIRVVLFTDIPIATRLITLIQLMIFSGTITLPWSAEFPPIGISNDIFLTSHSSTKLLRFLSSPYEHSDDFQFFINMTCFIYLGQKLERRYGALKFPILIAFLGIMSSMLYVSVMQFRLLGNPVDMNIHHYASGFTGVLFALEHIYILSPDCVSNPLLFFGLGTSRMILMAQIFLVSSQISGFNIFYNMAGICAGIIFTHALGRRLLAPQNY